MRNIVSKDGSYQRLAEAIEDQMPAPSADSGMLARIVPAYV